MGKTRRTFTREFKVQIVRAIEAGADRAEICRKHNLHHTMLTKWKRDYQRDPEGAFRGGGSTYKPEAQIAELERKIGQLYLENDLLKKALSSLENTLSECNKKRRS